MRDVYIADAVRTPIGKIGGALARTRPDDLAASAIAGLLARSPGLDPAHIGDVCFGNGNGAGEENRNVARMALLLAGVPPAVPGVTLNRLCGSGLEAAAVANREVAVGDADICVAGGVESMSRAPWVVPKPERPYERGHQQMHSTTLGWRLVNPRHPPEWTISLGEGAEILADQYGITRQEQDQFAYDSHQKAHQAWTAGKFDAETVPVNGAGVAPDESVRPDTSIEALAGLKPAFRREGTVTAGNSSPMSDGAAAVLLASDAGMQCIGREPLARIAARAVSGVEPHLYGIGPVEAAETALQRAGIGWGDLSAVELNEAFAAQALACVRLWPDLDPTIVNPNGGAIAIGHPIGASGARILATLANQLHRSRGRYGMAALCIGVGQGIAVVIEAQ